MYGERKTAGKQYRGLDFFRTAAAVMVVAIHTAPFSIWSSSLDFIITCCIFRVAVPFFFMVTGFFVMGPCITGGYKQMDRVKKFYRKTLLLYLGAIFLYLPVNIYAGSLPGGVKAFLRMLFFDGTFYHLWYFPAVMIGGLLLLVLSRISLKCAAIFSATAYCLGVLGDSWYGIAERFPWLSVFYRRVFMISSYSRNGIFFAPLFLLLGVLAFRCPLPSKTCGRGLAVSFLVMLAEGSLSRIWHMQRHNSMYLALPFVMFFLFQLLLKVRGDSIKWMRDCSAWVYVIHPAVIIGIRGFAKLTGMTGWLIENTFLNFLAVCLVSFLAAWMLQRAVCFFKERRRDKCIRKTERG
ncbi:MAG: acyltransferase family protein [Ruminococcus sp.]